MLTLYLGSHRKVGRHPLRAVLRTRRGHARLMIQNTCLWGKVLLFGLVGYCCFGAFGSPMRRDKDIVITRKDNTKQNQEQTKVRQNKARYHHRVISQGIELWISKAEHNRQDRCANITKQNGPECRDLPVSIATNHEVEIAP